MVPDFFGCFDLYEPPRPYQPEKSDSEKRSDDQVDVSQLFDSNNFVARRRVVPVKTADG